jgi:hypothetical protein
LKAVKYELMQKLPELASLGLQEEYRKLSLLAHTGYTPRPFGMLYHNTDHLCAIRMEYLAGKNLLEAIVFEKYHLTEDGIRSLAFEVPCLHLVPISS